MNERRFSYEPEEIVREVAPLYPDERKQQSRKISRRLVVTVKVLPELLGAYGYDPAPEDELPVVEDC